ncbi:MAG: patatin-like phospholipase family protein [Candidatus Omnitrophica bacterium]|nr:patatin-like phospholipase family protein [Candidatus Omnitrophota bacterium]
MSMIDYLPRLLGKKRKTALVLGGGSARGIAHIGVLKILQKEKIKFDLVVGTSIGAFIGAAYSLGVDMKKAEEMALTFNVRESLDFIIPPGLGLIRGNRIYSVIKDFLGDKKFSDLKIPTAIIATNIESGQEVVFTEGPLAEAVRVSCSYPGIFAPQRINGQLLVDGGIINTVPVSVARDMGADTVVAIDVGFCVNVGEIKSIFGIIFQAFQITGDELNRHQSKQADIIIRPELKGINQLDFDSAKIAIQKGEIAALEKIKELRRKIGVINT